MAEAKDLTRDEILETLRDKRTKCIVYTRVMGYFRPVEGFNVGKTGEHRERILFEENLKQDDKDIVA